MPISSNLSTRLSFKDHNNNDFVEGDSLGVIEDCLGCKGNIHSSV